MTIDPSDIRAEPALPDAAEQFMRAALDEARAAAEAGEVPVGAVVVIGGTIAGRGRNSPRGLSDPTAHAEIMALREACEAAGTYRLTEADLYVTLEPCLMCVGAAVHARLRSIVFGAADPKAGATWVLAHEWPGEARLNHRVGIRGGVMEKACSSLLQKFFSDRR